jgi:hypothetical protein
MAMGADFALRLKTASMIQPTRSKKDDGIKYWTVSTRTAQTEKERNETPKEHRRF